MGSPSRLPNLWSAHGVRYLTFTWDDDPNYTLFDTQDARCCVVVEQIVAFVDEALCAGESVLLHSFLGTGRSGSSTSVQVSRSRLMAKLPPRERHDALEAARRLVDWDARVPRLAARFEAGGEGAEDLVDDEPLLVLVRSTARATATRSSSPSTAAAAARAADDAELPAVAWDAQANGQAPGGAPPGNQARPQSAPVSRRDAGAAPAGRAAGRAGPAPLLGAASLSMRTGRSPGGGGRPGSSGDRRHVHADFPDPFPANRVVYGGPQPRRGGADRPSSAPTRRTPAGAPKGALPKQLNAKHGRDASIEELMIRGATRRPPRHAPDPLAGDRWAQPTRVYAPKRTTKPKRDRADVPHRARPQY
ncbi:hypothetical protein JL721_1288 [Aureococcus anophagefferens]|nr:hypothetical protein JL721_1288 [Aureococcus anophagefferens]